MAGLPPEVQQELEQLERFKAACAQQKQSWASFLNNFVNRLPYSERIGSPRCYFENDYPDVLDKKVGDFEQADPSLYSDRYRLETQREFYATIDQALKAEGIYDLVKSLVKPGFNIEEVYEAALPAYLRLRAMGYKAYPDLTA